MQEKINYHLLLLTSLLVLCANNLLKAQSSQTGDLETYINGIIAALPGEDGNEYAEPVADQINIFARAVQDLYVGNTTDAHDHADSIDYEVVLYTDNSVTPNKLYYLLQLKSSGTNYWGTYIFNPSPCRELVIQSPHPKKDFNTGKEGFYCFKNTNARAFLLSGTHRCNQTTATSCDGTSSACSSTDPNFSISDMAHNSNNPFQRATQILHNELGTTVFVQLHGFTKKSTDPYVILSNGTTSSPSGTDYADDFKTELANTDGTLTFKVAHIDSWTRLIGTTNIQGRYINGETVPCTNSASSATGRFIHLEQEKTKLRDNSTGWAKVSTALSNLIPCVALPVELMTFEVELSVNKTVSIFWKTASELNNSHFEIEHSFNGSDWELLEIMEGKGTSLEISTYEYEHKRPTFGTNYYRLKQVDFDGSYVYSIIKEIEVEALKTNIFQVFPNPVDNVLNISITPSLDVANGVRVEVVNVIGQLVMTNSMNNHQTTLNTERLTNGLYLMQLRNVAGTVLGNKLIMINH